MIQRRTNHSPNTMGSFVPMLGTGYAAPSPRTCTRCGCRLSRYAKQTETLCAPCHTRVNPWQPPATQEKAPSRTAEYWQENKSRTCRCGNTKSDGARSCLRCYLARIGRGHPEWYGPVCQCGGPKSDESRMCKQCRYPNTRRSA